MTRSFALIGEPEAQAAADAKTVMDLETAIAKITIPPADLRDPVATYHKMSLAEFGQSTPHIDWQRFLQEQGAKTTSAVNVRTPTYFTALDTLLTATPVDAWKAYLRWHVTNGAMNSLGSAFRREAFRWQQVTSGVKEEQPRVKLCAAATSGALGDILIARLVVRGVAGVVADGGMRDIEPVQQMTLPVFCRGHAAPPSFASLLAADVQRPIGCGGVLVLPGDIVVAEDRKSVV